ncbi:YheC/YheD family protein [Paenibacillus foliorum]|uniref:YheC/YheD family protein n=1 Tax=Paenibacillus foliorum TaxID=2654974 RepID=UPI001490F44D|nr:YheC/YheD family protein [Paenibacillus foliorum]
MKKKNTIRTLTSKWTKTLVLLKSNKVRRYIPETRLFNKSSVLSLLKKYQMVYVKPVNGSFGQGVIRVDLQRTKSGSKYRYQHGTASRSFGNYDAMYSSISKSKLKRSYLVQKGIHMLKYNNRVFDIRIMVQKNRERKWEASGYIGRVAHPKKIVTNFHNSGKPLPLETLLERFVQGEQKQAYIRDLKNLGYQIAVHLNKHYPGFREIGVDIGIDKELKPWIFEVNTAPDPLIFNQLKDKRMFRKVIHYARLNGRFRKK